MCHRSRSTVSVPSFLTRNVKKLSVCFLPKNVLSTKPVTSVHFPANSAPWIKRQVFQSFTSVVFHEWNIPAIKDAFSQLDPKKQGVIPLAKIAEGMQKCGINLRRDQLQQIMNEVDEEGERHVTPSSAPQGLGAAVAASGAVKMMTANHNDNEPSSWKRFQWFCVRFSSAVAAKTRTIYHFFRY